MEQTRVAIIANTPLSKDIFRMELDAPSIASSALPGQFLMVKASDDSTDPLLRRPFSIHNATSSGAVHIVYKVVGKGTELLSKLAAGGEIDIVGPLGKGFAPEETEHFLVGGGLGIAPMKLLAKKIIDKYGAGKVHLLLGARNKEELHAFEDTYSHFQNADVSLATDDGSTAHRGFVTDLLGMAWDKFGPGKRMIYCCGPHPMMKSVVSMAKKMGWNCQVSLETMMACGISACLGCTVESTVTNSKGGNYLHVCQDGPVFDGKEVQW